MSNKYHESTNELVRMVSLMRNAYKNGENVMQLTRKLYGKSENSTLSTLISYDLQSGSYTDFANENNEVYLKWCKQIAELLNPLVQTNTKILEVGCGEATTLSGVIKYLQYKPLQCLGFDISWSRIFYGNKWLENQNVDATLFVADLFSIPLADNSVDVVYTSHSLEPNGGKELEAIQELIRVSRHAVVLIEPIYELASAEAQKRMEVNAYVRNLKNAAESFDITVEDYRLLDFSFTSMNPSGVILIRKNTQLQELRDYDKSDSINWKCHVSDSVLVATSDGYFSQDTGLVYPVVKNIPLLRKEHVIVASSFL